MITSGIMKLQTSHGMPTTFHHGTPGFTPHLAARMRNKRVSRWATSSSSVAIKSASFVSFRPEDGLKAKVFFPPIFSELLMVQKS